MQSSPSQPSLDALHDHGPLELREHAAHLEHRLSRWRACVDALWVQVEIDLRAVYFAEKYHKVLQAAAQPAHGPRSHDAELAARHVPAQHVELRALVASLGPTVAFVRIFSRNLPATPLAGCAQFEPLVLIR